MNRMNNDGIIEWYWPLVSTNHGEKWRRNSSSWLLSRRSPLPKFAALMSPAISFMAFILGWLHSIEVPDRRLVALHHVHERQKKTPVSSSVQIRLGALAFYFGATRTTSTSAGETQTVGSTSMTNSGSADETENETRTRKIRQAACSRKRIWKARARQKSPRIVLEADLWKMPKNSTPWVWLEWIEFFSFFQHFQHFEN